MDCSLHDEIARVHIDRAISLLTRSTLSIEEVALQSGSPEAKSSPPLFGSTLA